MNAVKVAIENQVTRNRSKVINLKICVRLYSTTIDIIYCYDFPMASEDLARSIGICPIKKRLLEVDIFLAYPILKSVVFNLDLVF